MKRIFSILLVLALCASFGACATTEPTTPTDSTPAATTPSGSTPEPTDPTPTTPEPSKPQGETKTPSEAFVPKASDTAVDSGTLLPVTDASLAGFVTSKKDGNVYISSLAPVFEIGGIRHPSANKDMFNRLDVTNNTEFMKFSDGVRNNSWSTAGVTVRFRTNASQFVLQAEMHHVNSTIEHMTPRAAYGFDVYIGTGTAREYRGDFLQTMTDDTALNEVITLPGEWTEVLINFPLYSGVKSLNIGLPEGAQIAEPLERTNKPILFYGSSITQGASPSRPGGAYTNIVTRMFDADCINLGFSGSAKGEQIMAQEIASRQDLAAIVIDYDHNSTVDELRERHYAFYKTVRAGQPDTPIILASRPTYATALSTEELERINIIQATYQKAVSEGDTNIYFIDGSMYFMNYFDSGLYLPDLFMTDNAHPNGLGQFLMAMNMYDVLYDILEK